MPVAKKKSTALSPGAKRAAEARATHPAPKPSTAIPGTSSAAVITPMNALAAYQNYRGAMLGNLITLINNRLSRGVYLFSGPDKTDEAGQTLWKIIHKEIIARYREAGWSVDYIDDFSGGLPVYQFSLPFEAGHPFE